MSLFGRGRQRSLAVWMIAIASIVESVVETALAWSPADVARVALWSTASICLFAAAYAIENIKLSLETS